MERKRPGPGLGLGFDYACNDVNAFGSDLPKVSDLNTEEASFPKRVKLPSDPEPVCLSAGSKDNPFVNFNNKYQLEDGIPRSSDQFEMDSSCLSLKSNWSKFQPPDFKRKPPKKRRYIGLIHQGSKRCSAPSAQQHQTQLDDKFQLLTEKTISFVKQELNNLKKVVSGDYPESSESQREEDGEQMRSKKDALVKILLSFLNEMKEDQLADCLWKKFCQQNMKSSLKKKFQCLSEGITKAGHPTLLNQIYTELYITKGGAAEVNKQHEVRRIEAASRKADRAETRIRQEDIFTVPPGRREPARTVLTKGVAGIGKTVLTQKFTLDWAEDKTNQNIHFIFPFTFRELNVLKEERFSLVELIHHFFTETKEIHSFEAFQVVFIFDGLDECRLPLDFHSKEVLTDVTESTSVDVLLTNLIRGKLLPSARLWITTRPAAANQIPPECVSMVTEVRGFTDPQKDEYFRKRFKDEKKATEIIAHIRATRSLHIMCHIPVFCWITATVLEDLMQTREGGELPKTLTEMYIHFLVVQTKVQKIKYDGGAGTDPTWSPESRRMITSLGKLAFDGLQKGNLIFYESDLTECGIDIRAASVYSGVFTQIFREERGLYQDTVFCFVHLSVQEFLAALHVHQTFINSGVNLMEKQSFLMWIIGLFKKHRLLHFYQTTVDKTLESQNGHLDLFLRFLLGLSLKINQKLLQIFLNETGSASQTNQRTIEYIKKKLNENVSVERSINLLHCLNELNDCSLVEEIQQSLRSGRLSTDQLSPAQWSALVFILLSSDKDLDVFDLKKYSASEKALLRLLPVVKASKKALMSDCFLSDRSCEVLSSALSLKSGVLEQLDLSNNHLQDSGVEQLSAGLRSPHCRLQVVRLAGCLLSDRSCEVLSSALSLQSGALEQLDLSNNHLHDSGVEQLSAGLRSPHCRLQVLRLNNCDLSEISCETLSSVLFSKSSSLRDLDLSNNDLKDSGVESLCAGLDSSHCSLEILRLSGCLLTDKGFSSLSTTLSSKLSPLKELDLTYNHPGEDKLGGPNWTEETLRMEPTGRRWLKPGLRKYSHELTIDMDTVNRTLIVSEDNKHVTCVDKVASYPDDPKRFDHPQLLSSTPLPERSYWEVEWKGDISVSVSYSTIRRRGSRKDCVFGENALSWSLNLSEGGYSVSHNGGPFPLPSSSSVSNRAAVYVDCPAGLLSFYKVSSDSLIHLHTFSATITQDLYPGLRFQSYGSSVFLC